SNSSDLTLQTYNVGNIILEAGGGSFIQGGQYTGNSVLTIDQLGGGDILTASASGTTMLTLTADGHLLPGSDDAQDLGSSTLRWRDLYLGPASLHIGCTTGD